MKTPKQIAIEKKLGGAPKSKGSAMWKMYYEPEETKKEPKITKHENRHHVIAEHHAQKADPHYEMADFRAKTRGAQVYKETLAKSKALSAKTK